MSKHRRISEMTSEQAEYLPIFREEMRAKALRGQWASDDQMRDAVRAIYAARGLTEPLVLVFGNPALCLMARSVLRLRDQLGAQLRDQLGAQLRDQLWGQLRDQLWGQLGDQLWGQLRDQLWGQLRDQLGGQLGAQLRGQLRDQLGDQLGGQLWGQLWGQLGAQLRDQLGGQLRDQLGGQLRDQLGGQLRDHDLYQTLWFAGGSEAYWISFYAYGHHIGVTWDAASGAGLRAWERYAEICGPLYPYAGIAFVSRRPDTQFDDARRLHCETGPAMRFEGYGVYAWHGVRVPAAWIEGRATLDPTEVLRTENVEQRHAGLQIVGWARVAEELGCRVIDSDPDPQHGDLIELTIPGLPRPGRFLRAECPRNGTICEGVPYTSTVDGSPIESVLAAQAWRVRRTPATFTYPEIRT